MTPTVLYSAHAQGIIARLMNRKLLNAWTAVHSLSYSTFFFINPRRVGGLNYSSLSVCVCVRAQFGLPGDLGITICT